MRTETHALYLRVGYTNLETQYSYAKCVGTAASDALRAFVPRVT